MHSYASLIFPLLLLLLLFMIISRARRQQRALVEIQAAIEPGSRVMTTSGVHGTVISVQDPKIVVLEIAPGVHTRWARAAIARILDPHDDVIELNDESISLSEPDLPENDEHDRDDSTLT